MRDGRKVATRARRDLLFEACIEHRALDPQLSSNRGRWLARVLEAAGDLEVLAPRILAELAKTPDEYATHHDVEQMCELAVEFARRGLPDGREALRATLARNESSVRSHAGSLLVELEGLAGLESAVCHEAERMSADADHEPDWYLLSHAEDHIGLPNLLEWLASESAHDPAIARYRDRVLPEWEAWNASCDLDPEVGQRPDRERLEAEPWWGLDLAAVRGRLLDSAEDSHQAWCGRWGKYCATEEDLRGLLSGLDGETDRRVLVGSLRAFTHRDVPFLTSHLLALTGHSDEQIAFLAHGVCGKVRDDRVHALALEKLSRGVCDGGTMLLLMANYHAADAEPIRRVLPTGAEPWTTHEVTFHLLDVLERHATRDETDLVLWCYEWAACENHRGDAVELLKRLEALPADVADEGRYDSSIYVRESVCGGPVPFDAPLPPR